MIPVFWLVSFSSALRQDDIPVQQTSDTIKVYVRPLLPHIY
jgi:hypothetical protein